MIRLARRVALLVAFYLLTSVATAHAECAWVLWLHYALMLKGESWKVENAYQHQAECLKTARKEVEEIARLNKGGPSRVSLNVERNEVTLSHADDDRTWRFLCLPDTVDPRGPKGK